MNVLLQKRLSYIEAATGKMKMLDHIADVLFAKRILNNGELDSIQSIEVTQDKARVLIDTARRKGDTASNTLMATWDNYPGASSVGVGNVMSPKEIVSILANITRDDMEKMKLVMSEIEITHRHRISAVDLQYVTDRAGLAEVMALHYGAAARAGLNTLLKKIGRNDLVKSVKSSDCTQTSSQLQPVAFATSGKVINKHQGAVTEKVLNILCDLDRGQLKRFIWTLQLPSSRAELIRNATDLAKVLKEHVHHDMASYLDIIYKTLRGMDQNSLADELKKYIAGLSP